MGSVVLKLQLTWGTSCLLFLLPFSAWLWPSLAMATMVMDMAMVMDMGMAMVTTMASDLLKPSQDMDFMDSMARDLLSQDMDTMDMAMDTMDTMARDLLMPSQDMDIMAMDM